MPCERRRGDDGGIMFVCGRGRAPKRVCAECGVRPVLRLCDYLLAESPRTVLAGGVVRAVTVRQTCDRGLCVQCAIHVGPERDLCPEHAPAAHAGLVAQIKATNARQWRREER